MHYWCRASYVLPGPERAASLMTYDLYCSTAAMHGEYFVPIS